MSDRDAGKRLIGSAYQARAIAAGLERYDALPDDYPGNAVAEAIKTGIETMRPHILEEAARIAEETDVIHDARDTDDCLSRQKTAERIAAAIRAAKDV